MHDGTGYKWEKKVSNMQSVIESWLELNDTLMLDKKPLFQCYHSKGILCKDG